MLYQGDTAGEANEELLEKTKQTAEQSFQTEPSGRWTNRLPPVMDELPSRRSHE